MTHAVGLCKKDGSMPLFQIEKSASKKSCYVRKGKYKSKRCIDIFCAYLYQFISHSACLFDHNCLISYQLQENSR